MDKEEPKTRPVKTGAIISRIYVTEEGDLVVTDLWEELEKELVEKKGFER